MYYKKNKIKKPNKINQKKKKKPFRNVKLHDPISLSRVDQKLAKSKQDLTKLTVLSKKTPKNKVEIITNIKQEQKKKIIIK